MTSTERLQKMLARAGLGSRRHCETLIGERRVRVNGAIADTPGTKVDPVHDEVTVDGVPVESEAAVYYLLNKPKGYLCTNRADYGDKLAVSLLAGAGSERLFTVGRLDEESEGAILVTNDGEFCNLVTHPRYGVRKTYRVVLAGKAEGELVERVRRGVFLAEGRTAPAEIHVVKRARDVSVLRITLQEGKNRHIRRVFARIGLDVRELLRIRVGPVALGALKSGAWRPLTRAEVEALREEARQNGAAGRPERPPKPRPRGAPGAARTARRSG